MSTPTEFRVPQARDGLSLKPAKELLKRALSLDATLSRSALIGGDFQQQAISIAIGEIQDALEAYAKLEREQP